MVALLVCSICWSEIWHDLRPTIRNCSIPLFWDHNGRNIRTIHAGCTHRWHTLLYITNCIGLRIVIHVILNFTHWLLIFIMQNNLRLYWLLLWSDFKILHKHSIRAYLLWLPHHRIILEHLGPILTARLHTCALQPFLFLTYQIIVYFVSKSEQNSLNCFWNHFNCILNILH